MEERLQKILARAGYGSRRANEDLIVAGRVRVNGKLAELGMKAEPQRDVIEVDGKRIPQAEGPLYVMVYKPRGVLSDLEPQDDARPTVRDLVPLSGHLFPVGRLDYDSEGLILLTNDGELANRLTHPRYGHEKEYRVQVLTKPDDEQLATWRRGVVLEDGYKTAPAQVDVEASAGKTTWLRVILHEGRKRQIRETGQRIGLPVARIIRVRISTLRIGRLKPREWRELTPQEVSSLRGSTGQKRTPRPRTASSAPKRAYSPKPASEAPKRPGSPRPASGGPKRTTYPRPNGGAPKRTPRPKGR
jgi:23S rRNA pseudouridine2605 synthase